MIYSMWFCFLQQINQNFDDLKISTHDALAPRPAPPTTRSPRGRPAHGALALGGLLSARFLARLATFILKAGDQLLEQRAQRFLLGLGQR